MPKVSIVIPVFNGANFLGEAISSALAQTYSNFEIIVVNDGSNDHGATECVAHSFGEKIRYFSKPNGGVASALNYGVAQMKGELFSWLSHDDIYMPHKLEVEVAEFVRRGGNGIIYADFHAIDKNTKRLYAHRLPAGIPPNGIRCFMTVSNALSGCTLLIPRDYLIEEKGFDESKETTQDYDLWFKIAAKHPFYHVMEDIVGVRHHAGQATISLQDCVQTEGDSLYYRFLSSLTRDEVTTYAKGDAFSFYLGAYRRFTASRFPKASQLAKQKCLLAIKEKDGLFFATLRYFSATWIQIPAFSLRVRARQALFQNDASWLAKLIILGGRTLLGRR